MDITSRLREFHPFVVYAIGLFDATLIGAVLYWIIH